MERDGSSSTTLTLRAESSATAGAATAADEQEMQLLVVRGYGSGRRCPVRSEVVLGRGIDCQLELMDDGVSRRHARVWRGEDGRIRVRDLRSRNGTFVNGVRIEEEVELELGDRIALGAQTMLELTAYDRLEDQRIQAQKLAAIGQLAGGIAHDFNNLLGVVLANVTYLLQLPQLEEKLAREVLGDVETAARRAVELTQELLAFARSRPLELQSLGVADLVAETHRLLRTRAKGTVTFDIRGDAGLTLLGDRSRMMQVLMNLGINALDAMPTGGVLRIQASQSTPESRADDVDARALNGECVRLAVEDSGIGMDAATASRVFEPFFTTKPRGQGTGLGLATVYSIVRDHGGLITLQTAPGAGTIFRVYLPLGRVPGRGALVPTEHRPSIVRGTVALLADDDALVRHAASRVLEHAGIEVIHAADGAEAVERWEAEHARIDVVVLDLDMPKLDGEQVLQRIRSMSNEVRVLVASGHLDLAREQHLKTRGVDGFLRKPYDSFGLVQGIAKALYVSGRS